MSIPILVSLIAFPLVDSIYLNNVAVDMYGKAIKNIQGSPMKLNIWGALGSYFFLSIGLYYFLLKDLDHRKSWFDQIVRAFIFGIVVYGVYETTNAAIISGWTWDLVIVDTLWGGILYSIIMAIALYTSSIM